MSCRLAEQTSTCTKAMHIHLSRRTSRSSIHGYCTDCTDRGLCSSFLYCCRLVHFQDVRGLCLGPFISSLSYSSIIVSEIITNLPKCSEVFQKEGATSMNITRVEGTRQANLTRKEGATGVNLTHKKRVVNCCPFFTSLFTSL